MTGVISITHKLTLVV